jgi:hypothetical protein
MHKLSNILYIPEGCKLVLKRSLAMNAGQSKSISADGFNNVVRNLQWT